MNPSDLVFVVQDQITQYPGKSNLIRLKHPRSGQNCVYIWNRISGVNRLYEIQRVSEKHRSWFLGTKIKSDGGAYLCTPINPLFLILSSISEQSIRNRFTTLHGLLANNPELATVFEDDEWERKLSAICDSKVAGEHTVYRYNESLALSWLSDRVNSVRQMLTSLTDPELIDQVRFSYSANNSAITDPNVGTTDAHAPAFAASSNQARLFTSSTLPDDMCQQFAYQLVADYLLPDLADQLRSHLHLGTNTDVHETSDTVAVPNGYPKENVNPVSAGGNSSTQPSEDYSNALKKTEVDRPAEPVSKKSKHSKGMQSIANFFGKRPTC
ncbi:hypothetical protein D915_002498 [Fasciola hepatica]|uniref:Ribonuclease H2 subunit B n=1 Tax=Fasciola hepatica TaxID=6192 RepID=A0A4E0RVR9_FASHE|nr:hypothetical protein D915_002498 [Fasciola hepatica]